MAFLPAPSKVPNQIGNIIVILKDAFEDGVPYQSATFQFEILDSDGNRMERKSGNLEPHITVAQKNALMSFMTSLRTQAESEVLP